MNIPAEDILELSEDILKIICIVIHRGKEIDFPELDRHVLPLKKCNRSKAYKTEEISNLIYAQLYQNRYSNDEINEYVKSRGIEKYYKKWWGRIW